MCKLGEPSETTLDELSANLDAIILDCFEYAVHCIERRREQVVAMFVTDHGGTLCFQTDQ